MTQALNVEVKASAKLQTSRTFIENSKRHQKKDHRLILLSISPPNIIIYRVSIETASLLISSQKVKKIRLFWQI